MSKSKRWAPGCNRRQIAMALSDLVQGTGMGYHFRISYRKKGCFLLGDPGIGEWLPILQIPYTPKGARELYTNIRQINKLMEMYTSYHSFKRKGLFCVKELVRHWPKEAMTAETVVYLTRLLLEE